MKGFHNIIATEIASSGFFLLLLLIFDPDFLTDFLISSFSNPFKFEKKNIA